MIIQEYNERLQRNTHQFIRTIRALSEDQFLQPMNGWSPRDVTAHLIGWNQAAVGITDDIRQGKTPEILIDLGEDFCEVNATFVHEYDSTDMVQLLRELELSYQQLARHLYTMDVEDWTREVTVPGWGNPLTIQTFMQTLTDLPVHYQQEIETWREGADEVTR